MGGAFGLRRGNRTPAAEANFYHAPEAAQAAGGIGSAVEVWGGVGLVEHEEGAGWGRLTEGGEKVWRRLHK